MSNTRILILPMVVVLGLASANQSDPGKPATSSTQNISAHQASQDLQEVVYPLGSIPEPVTFPKHHHTDAKNFKATLPKVFDLRKSKPVGVTSVKNQYQCGSCWTFATMGAIESNLLYTKGRYTDYSEESLNLYNGFNYGPCGGGSFLMSAAYLNRWSGPISQSDMPYTSWLVEGDIVSPTPPTPEVIPNKKYPGYHINQVTRIANGPGFDSLDQLSVKLALQKNGGVAISYFMDQTPGAYYNSNNASYYYPESPKNGPNHAVLIVGWDDNYPLSNFIKAPPGNGAYIVKNSWGTGWGDDGYFYVSYYDASLSTAYQFLQPELNKDYTHVYQYDISGHTGGHGFEDSEVGYFSSTYLSSKVGRKIKAIGFWALSDETDYEIRVYKDITVGYGVTDPTQGSLVAIKQGHLSVMGYNTIKLDSAADVGISKPFSVVIRVQTKDHHHPIPLSKNTDGYTSNSSAALGQSLISPDGVTWSSTVTEVGNKLKNLGNVNIKVFAGK